MSIDMDVRDTRIQGTLLVEASAGTGKTWTIGALLVRLLLEGRKLPEILILTFTEAATADLRERMRRRLEDSLAWLDGVQDVEDKEPLAGMVEAGILGGEDAARLLRQALAQFDEASIFTIHGFCHRILRELGLGAGLSRSPELGDSGGDAMLRVATDQLRRWWSESPHVFMDWLQGQSVGGVTGKSSLLDPAPWASLAGKAGEVSADGWVEAAQDLELIRQKVQLMQSGLQRMVQRCLDAMEPQGVAGLVDILRLLPLDRRSYAPEKYANELQSVERWLRAGAVGPHPTTVGKGNRWKFSAALLAEKTKGNPTPDFPAHPFFTSIGELELLHGELLEQCPIYLRALQVQAISEWPTRAAALRMEERKLDFHDLLQLVGRALAGPQAEALKKQLRERWQVAMLDEFQDTDPLQARIFHQLFREADMPLVLVGDPKQAIYGFRGADLDAYLRVARTADERRGLRTNWRSDAPLVDAVNQLFSAQRFPGGRGAFLHGEITYTPVLPCGKDGARAVSLAGKLLRAFHVFQDGRDGQNKESATGGVCRHVASLVQDLLDPHRSHWVSRADGDALGGIQGGEVAILVRTWRQGQQVAEALAARGISSIQGGRESVWTSAEASSLVLLLHAIERPDDSGLARALLAGSLAQALDGQPIASMQDDTLLATLQKELHQTRAESAKGSLVSAVERLLERTRWKAAMLARPMGERCVVNWGHLLELLRVEEARQKLDPGAMARHIQARGHEPKSMPDWEQRLESEDNLVRIVTMHKSKGLEYPLVICPFLWPASSRRAAFALEHVPARPGEEEGRLALMTPGMGGEEDLVDELRDAGLAESLRLAYVALTRARHQLLCYSISPTRKQSSPSALDWLLLAGKRTVQDHPGSGNAWNDLQEGGAQQQLEAWQELEASGGGLGVEVMDLATTTSVASAGENRVLEALPPCRTFSGNLDLRESMASFTSLLRDAHMDDRLDDWFGPQDEQVLAADELLGETDDGPTGRDGWGALPAGASTGICLHSLLEKGLAAGQVTEEACRLELLATGLPPDHAAFLAPRLDDVLRRPLGEDGPVLQQVESGRWATELEFHISTSGLTEGRLRELCRRHGLHDAQRLGVTESATLTALEDATRRNPRPLLQGFLKGFMDLCLCWREEWWVLDWKSNRLARQASHYTRERMVRSMAESGYFIQALIYLTALHRHLRRVDRSYNPAHNLGGLRYVYLRGLGGEGANCGVLTDRLPLELILELDEALGRQP